MSLLAVIAALALPLGAAPQADLTSSPLPGHSSQTSLQQQIDKASAGQTIRLAPGTYSGPITITKALTLRGEPGTTCAIELLADEPAIRIEQAQGVRLEDLTVRWSIKSPNARLADPAAVSIRDSSVTLQRCHLEPIDHPKQTPYGMLAAGRSQAAFLNGSTNGFAFTLMFIDGASGIVRDSKLCDAGHSAITLHPGSRVSIVHNMIAGSDFHGVRNTGGTMDMQDNLVVANQKAGAYLGNKSAHGTIANNTFERNGGGIWCYANSDVTVKGNVFHASQSEAIALQSTCKLLVANNSFTSNPVGIIQYRPRQDTNTSSSGARLEANHYQGNTKDTVDIQKESSATSGTSKLRAPYSGIFSSTSLAMEATSVFCAISWISSSLTSSEMPCFSQSFLSMLSPTVSSCSASMLTCRSRWARRSA